MNRSRPPSHNDAGNQNIAGTGADTAQHLLEELGAATLISHHSSSRPPYAVAVCQSTQDMRPAACPASHDVNEKIVNLQGKQSRTTSVRCRLLRRCTIRRAQRVEPSAWIAWQPGATDLDFRVDATDTTGGELDWFGVRERLVHGAGHGSVPVGELLVLLSKLVLHVLLLARYHKECQVQVEESRRDERPCRMPEISM
jgi:hypothetical protein